MIKSGAAFHRATINALKNTTAGRFDLISLMSLTTSDQVTFEGYIVDRVRGSLQWQDDPIAISRKTFDLLLYLIDHRDALASKEDLLSSLWPKQIVEESNLTQQVFVLRKALSRHSSGAKIIETVPARGYRFVAHVAPAPLQATPARNAPSGDGHSSKGHRPRLFFLASLILLLLGSSLYGWYYFQNRTTGKPVQVVLADFEIKGDPMLARALNAAVRIDLNQSPFVKVLSPLTVAQILSNMRQPKDAELTPALAREVCERNGSHIVLQGGAPQFGPRYLVNLRATACFDGALIAEVKSEAEREEDLPNAIDKVAAAVRIKLGESRASIASFDKPLSATHTGSLAALKAYTAGRREFDRGDFVAALPLLQQAVQLDPDYGDAYLDLSAAYYDLGDVPHTLPALKKAYELRATMGESNQQYVSGLYYEIIEEDLEKSVPAYKAAAALNPTPSSLGQLANVYYQLGAAPLGVEPAQKALQLDPSRQVMYKILAAAQLQAGLTADAAHTSELAIAKNPDDETMRDVLLMADYARRDLGGVEAQLEWTHAHRTSMDLEADEINIALARGEIRHAQSLLRSFIAEQPPPELQSDFENSLSTISREMADEGLTEDSVALTKLISPSTINEEVLVALVEDGITARAGEALANAKRDHPHSTLWLHVNGPQVEAAILLAQHKPADAVHALEPSRGFEKTTFGATYLRGEAYLQLGQFDLAGAEFKKITDSPWVDPTSNLFSLSFLELARAQSLSPNPAAAKASYLQFLDLWRSADPDARQLVAAKRELARLL